MSTLTGILPKEKLLPLWSLVTSATLYSYLHSNLPPQLPPICDFLNKPCESRFFLLSLLAELNLSKCRLVSGAECSSRRTYLRRLSFYERIRLELGKRELPGGNRRWVLFPWHGGHRHR